MLGGWSDRLKAVCCSFSKAIVVFRSAGSLCADSGVLTAVLAELFSNRGTILGDVHMFSGGALSRASILALGIMPYISASIIISC